MIGAKLIGVTQPVLSAPSSNAEDLVAFCARVSSGREYEDSWSIFEMVNAVVEVKAPRDISRQLLRHRSFSFQEFSQRYSDDIEFCTRETREQDYENRQNSLPSNSMMVEDASLSVSEYVKEIYNELIEHDVAKECARVVLPEGLTMSTLYVNGTLRSWLHYLEVRDDIGVTQKEHVLLAREIRKILLPAFPTVLKG